MTGMTRFHCPICFKRNTRICPHWPKPKDCPEYPGKSLAFHLFRLGDNPPVKKPTVQIFRVVEKED